MALLGNIYRFTNAPISWRGAPIGTMRTNYGGSGNRLNISFGLTDRTASIPGGCEHPTAWVLGVKGGGLATYNLIRGSGEVSAATLLMGRALSAGLIGDGAITAADLSLISGLLANLVGNGEISSANLVGSVALAANVIGSGDATAALGLIIWCVANLAGEGSISANLKGWASLACDIKSYGDLTPEGLRDAVWDALSASYNRTGTMGRKLNDAGSAGDPWSTSLPGTYSGTQAGALFYFLIRAIKNRKYLSKEGNVWYLIIRNDADTDNILKKALKDKNGNDITDIDAGLLSEELASSV